MNIISFYVFMQVIQNLQQAKKLVRDSSKMRQDERELALELATSLCEQVLSNAKRWQISINNALTKNPDNQAWANYYLVLSIETETKQILSSCKTDC